MSKKLIIFFPFYNYGGLEVTTKNLINFFIKNNMLIDVVSLNKFIKNPKLNFYFYNKKNKNFIFQIIYVLIIYLKCLINNFPNRKTSVILSMQNSIIAITVAKLFGFKIIARNATPIESLESDKFFFSKIKLYLKKKIYKHADIILSNSHGNAKNLERLIDREVRFIFNPIKRIKIIKKNNKKKQILYVGRLSYEKGIFNLISAFKHLKKNYKEFKNISLLIIGKGYLENRIKDEIKKNNLNNDIFLKSWTDDLSKYYQESKMIVVPSHYEGFGNVVIESLNYKLPIVSTNTFGPLEILNNGEFGKIVKKKNSSSLAKGIKEVLDNYPIYLNKVKKGNSSLDRFCLNTIGKKYLNLFDEL